MGHLETARQLTNSSFGRRLVVVSIGVFIALYRLLSEAGPR